MMPNTELATGQALLPPSGEDEAVRVARCGLPVFPLNPATGKPYLNAHMAAALAIPEPPQGQGGFKFARSDEPSVRAMWAGRPDAQIGIPTGKASGLYVLDIDRKNDKDGFAILAANDWEPDATYWMNTPSGGRHYYYSIPRDGVGHWRTDSDVLGKGIDRKGDGGFVRWYGHAWGGEALPLVPPPEWMLSATLGAAGDRRPLGDPDLAAPSLDLLDKAMSYVDPDDLSFGEWIALLAAFRQAGSTLLPMEQLDARILAWCAQYHADDPAESRSQIASLRATSLGWPQLLRRIPALSGGVAFGVPATIAEGGAVAEHDDFWATFGADDGARSTTVAAIRTLAENGLPIQHDQFADRIAICGPVTWDRIGPFPRQWQDTDTTGCKAALEMSFLKPSKETTLDAVAFVAKRSAFHPVRDYLDGLTWDGVGRLDQMASRYIGTPDTPFTRLALAKFMIQAVARIQTPGCKADAMLVLEGDQGIQKSTFANELFGDDWFADDLPDMRTKDAALQLRGKWGIEIGEMVGASRSEVNAVKRFIAAKKDTYRPPYGRSTIDAERHTVFIGTTNDYEYLTDPTGNRRFWPIACTRFDIAAVKRDRDQIWAEAMHRWQAGEQWWMDTAQEVLAAVEQEARREPDPWEDTVLVFVAGKRGDAFRIEDALSWVGITVDKRNQETQRRMGRVLRALQCDHPKIQGCKRWRASDETNARIVAEGVTVGDPPPLPHGPLEKPQNS
jgi:hypothetical protein